MKNGCDYADKYYIVGRVKMYMTLYHFFTAKPIGSGVYFADGDMNQMSLLRVNGEETFWIFFFNRIPRVKGGSVTLKALSGVVDYKHSDSAERHAGPTLKQRWATVRYLSGQRVSTRHGSGRLNRD